MNHWHMGGLFCQVNNILLWCINNTVCQNMFCLINICHKYKSNIQSTSCFSNVWTISLCICSMGGLKTLNFESKKHITIPKMEDIIRKRTTRKNTHQIQSVFDKGSPWITPFRVDRLHPSSSKCWYIERLSWKKNVENTQGMDFFRKCAHLFIGLVTICDCFFFFFTLERHGMTNFWNSSKTVLFCKCSCWALEFRPPILDISFWIWQEIRQLRLLFVRMWKIIGKLGQSKSTNAKLHMWSYMFVAMTMFFWLLMLLYNSILKWPVHQLSTSDSPSEMRSYFSKRARRAPNDLKTVGRFGPCWVHGLVLHVGIANWHFHVGWAKSCNFQLLVLHFRTF